MDWLYKMFNLNHFQGRVDIGIEQQIYAISTNWYFKVQA